MADGTKIAWKKMAKPRIDALYTFEGFVCAVVVSGTKALHYTRWYKKGSLVDRNRWAVRAAQRWMEKNG